MKNNRIIVLLIVSFLILFINGNVIASETMTLFVSVNGSDSADGSFESPFKTVERARDEIRKLNGQLPIGGITVYIREGKYQFEHSFVLESKDSGNETSAITYRAYPGENVDFIGGAYIEGNQFKEVTDENILNKVIDKKVHSKIKQVNLKELGFSNLGELNYPGGYWLPWMPPKPTPPELFVNESAMTIARYPNNGYLTISSIVDSGANPRMWEDDKKTDHAYVPEDQRNKEHGFTIRYADERISKWENAKEVKLHGFWYWEWADQTVDMKGINVSDKTLTSKQPSYYSVREGQNYYAYNLLEEIDMPGEYFIDRDTGFLYFYPPTELSNAKITLSLVADSLIKLNGASYITIKNINMSAMRGGAVEFDKNCKYSKVTGGEITNTGDIAVRIYGHNCGVTDTHIYNTNGGILLDGGDRITLTHGENYAENNHIEKYDRIKKMYNPGIGIYGCGNRASYNKIHDGVHFGIFYGGNDLIMEYNEIYDVLKETDDAGAIYSGKDWTYRGNEVKYNYIHDLYSRKEGAHGVHAIYLDDMHSSTLIMGNVIENVSGLAFQIGGGRDNEIFNNIVINAGNTISIDDRGTTWSCAITDIETGYLAIQLRKMPFDTEPWKSKYPKLATILEDEPAKPIGNMVENNVFVNSGKLMFENIAKEKTVVKNNFITKTDPGFYDMTNKNYLLKSDAKAFSMVEGLHNVPFTRMGNYTERAIKRVNNAVVLAINSPDIILNGKISKYDAVPKIVKEKTMVPLRVIAEAFGGEVLWSDEKKEVKIKTDSADIAMNICSNDIMINGKKVTIDTPAMLIDNKTYVPIRAIGEILNKQVYWNDLGLISISDDVLFNPEADENIIRVLYQMISIN